VHDDLIAEVETSRTPKKMAALREAMQSVRFKVAMLTTSKASDKSWGALATYKETSKITIVATAKTRDDSGSDFKSRPPETIRGQKSGLGFVRGKKVGVR